MTRKQIQEKYDIIGENKSISLYRKRGEAPEGRRFCGTITLHGGQVYFNGNKYKTLEDLDTALVEWAKSLPYDVDSYNPMYNENWRTEMRVIDYLSSIGFKQEYHGYKCVYAKSVGGDYKITFELGRRVEDGKVRISSEYAGAFYAFTADTAEEGINAISAIVNSDVLMMSKDIVDLLAICNVKTVEEVEAYTMKGGNPLNIKKVDFKGMLIDRLETMLTALKGE